MKSNEENKETRNRLTDTENRRAAVKRGWGWELNEEGEGIKQRKKTPQTQRQQYGPLGGQGGRTE